MTDMTVPRDPLPLFSELAVMLANNDLGRAPLAGVQKVGPDRYVVANWWPSTTNRQPALAGPRRSLWRCPRRPRRAPRRPWRCGRI